METHIMTSTTSTGSTPSPTENSVALDIVADPATYGTLRTDDAPTPQPLGAFVADHGPAAPRAAAIVTVEGRMVVVLRLDPPGQVEVHAPGSGVHAQPAATPAVPVTEPSVVGEVLAAAVYDLARWHAAARADLTAADDRHRQVLAEIREYVLERHLDGDICREGMNRFFEAFSLDPYDPRVRVRYTISGSYEVDAEDIHAASRDARGYLRPDLTQLDSLIDGSDDFTVDVTDVIELDS
jgi:hypothetical protein